MCNLCTLSARFQRADREAISLFSAAQLSAAVQRQVHPAQPAAVTILSRRLTPQAESSLTKTAP
ncbi:MAG TPA: hypothetical protein V6D06_09870 [Trichocoleus sp.]